MTMSTKELFAGFKGEQSELIPILQKVQEAEGYLSEGSMADIASFLRIPASKIYGVATFYAQFKFNPVGKYLIKVCHGTACHVQNASIVTESLAEALKIKDGGTTEDMLFTLESVACLGCCSLAPVMMIGDDTYGKLSGQDAVKVIQELKSIENN